MGRVIKYVFLDIIRTRFIVLYTLLLFISTFALFQLDSDPEKVVMSLLNVVLMVVPIVSVVFTTIHFYNSYEFIELMLAQPINRKNVFVGEFLALASSLLIAFVVGVGIPMLIYGVSTTGIALLICGTMLTLVFVALAFLAAVMTRDKAKAIGMALGFWFYFSLIYDGFLLWFVYAFSDYPLEKITLCLIALNPIDIARVIMLLQLDISALMGYTGAFYKEFFGNTFGIVFSFSVLLVWIAMPFLFSLKIFVRKDL